MRVFFLVDCVILVLLGGCGSSDSSSGDAGTPSNSASGLSSYFACESISGVGPQASIHFCMEKQSTTGKFDLTTVAPQCVDSPKYTGPHGFGLSTTLHCPRNLPGCGCTDDNGDGTEWMGQYQTELDNNVYKEVSLLCGGSSHVECFGGLSAP